jgi:hypothetical protein
VGVHVSLNAVVDLRDRLPTKAGEEVVDVQLGGGAAGRGSADASDAPPISIVPLATTPTTALRTVRPDTNMGNPLTRWSDDHRP